MKLIKKNTKMKSAQKIINQLLFSLIIVYLSTSCAGNDPAQSDIKTSGSMVTSLKTSTYNGSYGPNHVLAIWIENYNGKFIKSLKVNAASRKQYLTNWLSSTSSGNTTDAVTGATLRSHTTHNCTWNGKDFSGNVMGDGTYYMCVEYTENNGTGKFAKFSFVKGLVVDNQNPATKSGVSNVSIVWTPN